MILAFQGGLLNIGGFLALHRFVSHVTGFATFFGAEVSAGRYDFALGMLLVPFWFLCGAMISGFLVDLRSRTKKRPKYYLVFGVMFVLLMVVVIGGFNGLFGVFGEPLGRPQNYLLLALLCLICGIQNATVTSVSRAVVRTTHLTGITTDLGIGLVRIFNRRLLGDVSEDIKANWMRTGIILFFIAGSVVGGFLYRAAGYRGFILPLVITGLLFNTTFYLQVIRKQVPR